MRLAAVGLVAVVLSAGAVLAAGPSQSGECDAYAGDWRAQATPLTSGGPPLWPYLGVGACASVDVVASGSGVAFDLRADIVDPETSHWVVKYGAGGFSSTFDCGVVAWCELGPLHGTASPRPACAKVEIWKDGAKVRSASSCA